jgi:hypothetical protein
MSRISLERAVARATGESRREIRRRGFGLVNLLDVEFDREPNDLSPQFVDWDELEANRPVLFP